MSTISVTQKNPFKLLSNRQLWAVIGPVLITLLVAIRISASTSPSAPAFDHDAYRLFRQGEWRSVPISVSNAEAYQIFRRGEVLSPLTNAEAYQLFRAGEVSSPQWLTEQEAYFSYRQGEWTFVPIPVIDLQAYFLSEHTMIDPGHGRMTYFNSERTLVPARNLNAFTAYQRSEWFGK